MTVAYWTADREAFLGIFSSPDKFYGADPFTFWFAALIILVFGAGFFSLDCAIKPVISRLVQTDPRAAQLSSANRHIL